MSSANGLHTQPLPSSGSRVSYFWKVIVVLGVFVGFTLMYSDNVYSIRVDGVATTSAGSHSTVDAEALAPTSVPAPASEPQLEVHDPSHDQTGASAIAGQYEAPPRNASTGSIVGVDVDVTTERTALPTLAAPPTPQSISAARIEQTGISEFRVCRNPMEDKADYICEGDEYVEFGQKLQDYIQCIKTEPTTIHPASPYPSVSDKLSYGRRDFPFPPNANILMLGNSHTRQMANELACQYQDRIVAEENLMNTLRRNKALKSHEYYEDLVKDHLGNYQRIEFENNSTFTHVTNTFLIHLPPTDGIPKLLFVLRMQSLDDYSALLIGRFNHVTNSRQSTYLQVMKDNWNIDMTQSPPMQYPQLSEYYHGPAVAYSMFAASADEFAKETREYVERFDDRLDLKFVDVRRHIPALGECSSTKRRKEIGRCDNQNANSHKCTGIYGGHPTLVAWDLVEATREVLRPHTL